MSSIVVPVLIVTAFVAGPVWMSVEAYRGRYRSWTYTGLGTRYGAFAAGWIGIGLYGVLIGGLILQRFESIGTAVGVPALLAVFTGMGFFAWMPSFLVPHWRRELLKNAKLYRNGDPESALQPHVLDMDGGRRLVAWRRTAPTDESEKPALAVTGMHIRPRLRLAGVLHGPLPDRVTGAVTDTPVEVTGELLVDGELAAFVQAPAEDAEHGDNWFAVLREPVGPDDVAPGAESGSSVVALGTVPRHGPVQLLVPDDAARVRRALARGTKRRRVRNTIDSRWSRVPKAPTT
ncbi:hypothetical protein CLV30_10991 [Haloactinopolyspora alba]|uniref:Uncharacterized protein n=1 Tax=Haloactinopolyspora alba TaxID=648780 RepID=A0A2P8DZZ6_9ACTN|nr:hypothetical protein [Haloactinopolyspora alba]PSL02784.1 hypothetical protein CLV30_10991 [Haloactinopolyspora alba]